MSGHSKFANIKHKKAKTDVKRGKTFTKIGKEIMVATKEGGKDIDFNPRLRLAVDKAKAANMPKDNIDKAIKKGAGELDGVEFFEITYEGYAPEGVAVLIEALTDNKNRTAASVRSNFTKGGGNLGEPGSVNWMFERKGVIECLTSNTTEEQLMDVALESGADDIEENGDRFTILMDQTKYHDVKKAIEDAGIKYESSEITMVPKNLIEVTDEGKAQKVLHLFEALEDNEDVQNVYANFDIPDEILEKLL